MNEKTITIRRATFNDAPILADFNVKMADETEGKKLTEAIIVAGVQNLLQSPHYGFYLVAEKDRQVVAALMITYEWSDWRNGLFWWIQSVYVRPEFRRQGIYRQLYEFVRSAAAQTAGVCGLRLYVEQSNAIARQTYQNLGMQETHYRLFEEIF